MRRLLGALTCTLLLAACGGGGGAPSAEASPAAELSGELLVFAAASLTDAFEEIGSAFRAGHPDVTVTFNFASSSALAQQITEGAPADVFASANQRHMDVVGDAGLLAGEAEPFTGNLLQIAVETGNPLGITGLADLARPDVTLVLVAEEAPAGQYAREALDAQGVAATPSSLEADVRAALSRVALGEADASIVYASDVTAAEDEVDGVDIPDDQNVAASYPIATLAEAANPAAAEAFVELVRSAEGQAILGEHGFTRAP